jgi:hypothetical protein
MAFSPPLDLKNDGADSGTIQIKGLYPEMTRFKGGVGGFSIERRNCYGGGNYERIVIFQNFSPRMGWE